MNKAKTIITWVLGWPLSIVALLLVFRLILTQSEKITHTLTTIQLPLLIVSIACFFCYFFLRTLLWQHILQQKGYSLPLKTTAFLWSSSEIRRFIPGNIWSLIGRTTQFSEKNIQKKDIVSALLIEAEFVGIGSLIVSLLAVSYIQDNFIQVSLMRHLLIPLSLILTGILIAVMLASQLLIKKSSGVIKKVLLFSLPNFPPDKTLSLTILASIIFFFFGLGTYFSIASMTFLTPAHLFELIGLFSLSLFIGYLSFITPMGLGVREGLITLGLTPLLPITIAALASIFCRITLVASELIFFTFSLFGYKTKNTIIDTVSSYIRTHTFLVGVFACIGVFILYFLVTSFLRHDNFYTGKFDLGNMDQVVWNTSQGRIFEVSDPDGTRLTTRLSGHADFILLLLAPFYWIWSDPKMLLLIQTVVVGSGAWFVYKLSELLLKHKPVSFTLAFIFLLNPSLERATIFDFHAVTLATTFLLAAFYSLKTKKTIIFLLFLFLAGITKEQVWVVTGLFGLYVFFFEKKRLLGASIAVVSFSLFYVLLEIVIPQARGGEHFALSYYQAYGNSPTEVLIHMITSPDKLLATLSEKSRLYYLQQLFLPVGFLPLLAPLYLIFALPDLMINLLSSNKQLHQIYYHYTAVITPFLTIATIYSIRLLRKLLPSIPYGFYSFYLMSASLFSAYLWGPLPNAKGANLAMYTKTNPDKEIIHEVLSRIPKEYSVTATNNIGAHLSQRRFIATLPNGRESADIIAFLLDDPHASPSKNAHRQWVRELRDNSDFSVYFEQGSFIVFKREYTK